MIVLIFTMWHAVAELSLPAWQKEVRNIAREVVEAMKEAKNIWTDVMHEIFCLVITNLNLHTVEYLITRGIYTRCFNLSSFGQRKSTSCCGFMPFMKSTTCSGTGIFFFFIFPPMGNAIGVLLHLDPSVRFGFRLLCSVNPFLPRPIIQNQRLFFNWVFNLSNQNNTRRVHNLYPVFQNYFFVQQQPYFFWFFLGGRHGIVVSTSWHQFHNQNKAVELYFRSLS